MGRGEFLSVKKVSWRHIWQEATSVCYSAAAAANSPVCSAWCSTLEWPDDAFVPHWCWPSLRPDLIMSS